MKLSPTRIKTIQDTVLRWYGLHARSLPWRETHNPYKILVSEIMLQQTQVPRVIPKYEAFLQRFPTMKSLAAATSADVIREWKGLGYNRRALNLQRACRIIVSELNDAFPQTVAELMALPGIGRYTAGAIMNFAFNIDTPAVDTNVRLFVDTMLPTKKVRSENDYYDISAQLAPKHTAHLWLHAVMDYTSAKLRSTRPKVKKKKPEEKFIGSNRYLRGKILDALRIEPASKKKLYALIAKPLDISEDRFCSLLNALQNEGFLIAQSRIISLTA